MITLNLKDLLQLIDFSDNNTISLRDNSLNKDAVKHGIQVQISKDLNTNQEVDKLHGKFSPEKSFGERVRFLKQNLLSTNTKTLVLGISGGVDSLTAGLMAQRAVDELNEETTCKYQFIAMRLPYAKQKDADFVELSLKTIKPSVVYDLNIQESVNDINKQLSVVYETEKKSASQIDFIKGNIKARARMTAQYAVANATNGLVIGTDHAAEAVTGFFTKYGDGACDITPLTGLVKGQVREIAKYYGAPEELYMKVATADLEELSENKPDEDALGVSYQDLDSFLLCKQVEDDVFIKIVNQYLKTEHKRQQPVSMF